MWTFAGCICLWKRKGSGQQGGRKTPGREADETESRPAERTKPSEKSGSVSGILEGLGGRDNILSLDHCITRLRLEVRDESAVHQALLLSSGAKGVMKVGPHSVQVVIGMQVERVANELKELLEADESAPREQRG